MTENQYALQILARLKTTESQLPKPYLISQIPSVMQTLANRIADPMMGTRQSDRELLRKAFTITVTSGTGALTTPLTAAEPMLAQFARGWAVTGPDTRYLYSFVADAGSLACDFPLGLGRFTLRGTDLIVVNSLGNRAYTASFSVRAPYVPTLALLPVQFNDDALNIGMEFAQAGIPSDPPPESEG